MLHSMALNDDDHDLTLFFKIVVKVVYTSVHFPIILLPDILGLSPSKERFQKVLSNTLRGIPSVLTSKAIAMDGCVTDWESQEGETTTRSDSHKHPDK